MEKINLKQIEQNTQKNTDEKNHSRFDEHGQILIGRFLDRLAQVIELHQQVQGQVLQLAVKLLRSGEKEKNKQKNKKGNNTFREHKTRTERGQTATHTHSYKKRRYTTTVLRT